jgi:hypothetical protein
VRVGRRHIVGLLLAATALGAGGCFNGHGPKWPSFGHGNRSGELRVEQRTGGQPADLKAGEVVRVMRRIGLTDDQILNLGPILRNALRMSGAAAFVRGDQTDVMLAINDEHLFVQSRSQGSFIYDIKEKRFVAVPTMPEQDQ